MASSEWRTETSNGPFATRYSSFAIRHSLFVFAIRYVLETLKTAKGSYWLELAWIGIGVTFAWDQRRMRGSTRLETNPIEPKTQR
jgi:hypothetical protein